MPPLSPKQIPPVLSSLSLNLPFSAVAPWHLLWPSMTRQKRVQLEA